MKNDWSRWVPMGLDGRQTVRWIGAGMGLGVLFSLGFFVRLREQYRLLFDYKFTIRILRPDAIMPDFANLFYGSLSGLWVLAVCMLGLLGYHYLYHFQGSKSIYLMRRLPRRSELLRRCCLLPALTVVAICVLCFLLLLLYYNIYRWVTPEACLTPGQWSKIWT